MIRVLARTRLAEAHFVVRCDRLLSLIRQPELSSLTGIRAPMRQAIASRTDSAPFALAGQEWSRWTWKVVVAGRSSLRRTGLDSHASAGLDFLSTAAATIGEKVSARFAGTAFSEILGRVGGKDT